MRRAVCTALNVRGPGLALRGPEGSLKRAVDVMARYQKRVYLLFAMGTLFFMFMTVFKVHLQVNFTHNTPRDVTHVHAYTQTHTHSALHLQTHTHAYHISSYLFIGLKTTHVRAPCASSRAWLERTPVVHLVGGGGGRSRATAARGRRESRAPR
jgi:hypothetical protein